MAPEDAGFCWRGGTTLLEVAEDEPDADPGLGDVGGLLAVLLASLEQIKSLNECTEEEFVLQALFLNLEKFII